jgi:hypothetical protein
MTIQKSIVMLTNTGQKYDVVSEKYRADGYWGHTDGLHTISVSHHNLVGNLFIQGTLSTDPKEDDWFDIDINNKSSVKAYLEFHGESGVIARTFIGNFVYLRAILSRSSREDLSPLPNGNAGPELGQINNILLAM